MLRMKNPTRPPLSVHAERIILHFVLNGAERSIHPIRDTHDWFHKEARHALRYAAKRTKQPPRGAVLARTLDSTLNGRLYYSGHAVKNTTPNIAHAPKKALRYSSSAVSELLEIACAS